MSAAPSLRPPCETRIGKPDDLAFVVDVWADRLNTMRKGDATRHVRTLLARPESRLVIAHVIGEPDSILGWMAAEDASAEHRVACVHYIYVRRDARRLGIASAMLGRPTAIEYSHAAPKRWPPEKGQIGRPVIVPAGWTFNAERAVTR